MKTVLTVAAATALTLAAFDADAQTRRRARAAAAQPATAPLPPTPYRLVGPGASDAAAETAAQPAAPAAPTAPAEPANPGQSSTGVAPASPAEPAAAARPATDATPPVEAGGETGGQAGAAAGPASPEQARANTALTRVLGELAAGTPDYAQMNTETAARVRVQQPSLTPALKQYGAIKTITPLSPSGGSQRFRVTFANGEATFVIATDAAGKIIALGVE
jgi:hypothetical protein